MVTSFLIFIAMLPLLGVYVSVPWLPWPRIGIVNAINVVMAVLYISYAAWVSLNRQYRVFFPRVISLGGLLSVYLYISSSWSLDRQEGMNYAARMALGVAAGWLFVNIIRNRATFERVLRWIVYSMNAAAITILLWFSIAGSRFFYIRNENLEAGFGPAYHPLIIVIDGLVVAYYLRRLEPRRYARLYRWTAILGLSTLVVSQSRSGWILCFLFYSLRGLSRIDLAKIADRVFGILTRLMPVVALGGFLLIAVPGTYELFLLRTVETMRVLGEDPRLELVEMSGGILQRIDLLWGYGAGSTFYVSGELRGSPGRWLSFHNSFLSLFVDGGLVALFIFLEILRATLVKAWRLWKAAGALSGGWLLWTLTCVWAVFVDQYWDRYLWINIAIVQVAWRFALESGNYQGTAEALDYAG